MQSPDISAMPSLKTPTVFHLSARGCDEGATPGIWALFILPLPVFSGSGRGEGFPFGASKTFNFQLSRNILGKDAFNFPLPSVKSGQDLISLISISPVLPFPLLLLLL